MRDRYRLRVPSSSSGKKLKARQKLRDRSRFDETLSHRGQPAFSQTSLN